MEIIFVKRDTSEWDFMWLWLELHALNVGLETPAVAEHNGEVWQYLGSYRNQGQTVHEFRHRYHPITKDIRLASLHASETFTEDQIEKIVKIC